MSYFDLTTEIIIWPTMRFDLAWCLGRSYKMGFRYEMFYVLQKYTIKLFFGAFVYSFLGLCYFIGVLSDIKGV